MATAAGPHRFADRERFTDAELAAAPLRSVPKPSRLTRPLEARSKKAAAGLEQLGLRSVGDLLEHVPFRHEDRRDARPVASLGPGEEATVIVDVKRISSRRTRYGKTMQEATVTDDSGPMKAIWFNQPWLADKLLPGTRVVLRGKQGTGRKGFTVSSYEIAPGASADQVRGRG